MMVRILSILPGFVGVLCVILLLGSLTGFSLPEERSVIDMVPCESEDPELCLIAMTGDDISPPFIFGILDIDLEITWEKSEESWFAVVDSEAAVVCPPNDETLLTDCTVKDVENFIIVGGSDEDDGIINWNIETDDYRIISGGRGADIGEQQVLTTNVEISLNLLVELMLGVISLTLFLGAGEMAFPIRKLFQKFKES
ncbi:MAG: hypothetical protein CMB15_02150 [Euryarchaeota archaeon]|nr:hypothetical protein [Euryarchaeota archaeon]|tara:strand:+ start:41465 stop:42058 length:594 start_codon:yes stop_codon:yes gene_type:complete